MSTPLRTRTKFTFSKFNAVEYFTFLLLVIANKAIFCNIIPLIVKSVNTQYEIIDIFNVSPLRAISKGYIYI